MQQFKELNSFICEGRTAIKKTTPSVLSHLESGHCSWVALAADVFAFKL